MHGSPAGRLAATDGKKGSLFNIKVESLPVVKKNAKNSVAISNFKKN